MKQIKIISISLKIENLITNFINNITKIGGE